MVFQEWDIPTPGPGQILVKTEACGVCHTDVHAWHGDWPVKPTLPFIPGHEAIGRGRRRWSGRDDRERWATASGCPGSTRRAVIASIVCRLGKRCAPRRNSAATPRTAALPNTFWPTQITSPTYQPALTSAEAAPIICAGITTYKGIKETGAKPGQWIAISGIGGLGHLAIQYAKVMGLHVCAIDIDDGKLAHAKRLGADLVVNAKAGDPVAAVKKGTGGGAHGVLITAPSLGAFKQGVGMTRKRGTCVLIGLPPGEFPTPLFDVVANCITIRGSFVGTRAGHGRSARLRGRRQGQGRHRAATAVGDQ